VLASGEGSYGRLGQGNSDDHHTLTAISSIQGMTYSQTPWGESSGIEIGPCISACRVRPFKKGH